MVTEHDSTPPVPPAAAARADGTPDPNPVALVLIEDNRLLREGLAALITTESGFTVLAASADVDEAIGAIREGNPDVVLLDVDLEDHDSLGVTATIHGEVPEAKVVIIGLLPVQDDVAAYVRAGASGFVMKDASLEVLVTTIRAVAGADQVLPDALIASLFTEIASTPPVRTASQECAVRLTPRQQEVVNLLGEGLSNKEIASRLHIAVHTVKSHVHNVLKTLELRSRLEIVAFSRSIRRD